MKPEVLLELLEGVADQLEVKVSYEALQTSGLTSWRKLAGNITDAR